MKGANRLSTRALLPSCHQCVLDQVNFFCGDWLHINQLKSNPAKSNIRTELKNLLYTVSMPYRHPMAVHLSALKYELLIRWLSSAKYSGTAVLICSQLEAWSSSCTDWELVYKKCTREFSEKTIHDTFFRSWSYAVQGAEWTCSQVCSCSLLNLQNAWTSGTLQKYGRKNPNKMEKNVFQLVLVDPTPW